MRWSNKTRIQQKIEMKETIELSIKPRETLTAQEGGRKLETAAVARSVLELPP